jgi:hypothetical protein
MAKIACSVCGRGPAYETGAVALFADGHDAAGRPIRFCPEHLPLDAARGRQSHLLDPDVRAVFDHRLAETS